MGIPLGFTENFVLFQMSLQELPSTSVVIQFFTMPLIIPSFLCPSSSRFSSMQLVTMAMHQQWKILQSGLGSQLALSTIASTMSWSLSFSIMTTLSTLIWWRPGTKRGSTRQRYGWRGRVVLTGRTASCAWTVHCSIFSKSPAGTARASLIENHDIYYHHR